jgi:hypothetical protein
VSSQPAERGIIPPGKFVREIDITPFKEILDSERADVPDTYAAVLELVDNPIEKKLLHPEQFTTAKPLRIEVFVHDYSAGIVAPLFAEKAQETRECVVVQDNAGGLDEDEFPRLFRLGEPGETADQGISEFGRGGKRGRLRLGNLHVVISRKHVEHYSWWEVKPGQKDDKWKIRLHQNHPPNPPWLPKGSTRVAVSKLIFPITNQWVTDLETRLAITYADIMRDSKTEIYLNGKKIVPKAVDDSIDWCGATLVQPRKIRFSYDSPTEVTSGEDSPKTQRVEGEVTIGLLTQTTQGDNYGFDIICNGRLLAQYVKKELGFCEKPEGWDVKPNPKVSPVRGFIRLCGPSKAMPWRPNKVELDERKIGALRSVMVQKCKYMVDAAREITGLGEGGISGTLSTPFTGEIKVVSDLPTKAYKPPSLVGQQKLKKVSFKISQKKAELAKIVFSLETDRELNEKAREVFENAVDTEASLYKGGAGPIDFKGLRDAGIPGTVRRKLGVAGVVDVEFLLMGVAKKTEKEAVAELRSKVSSLSLSEAKQLYRVVRKMTERK